eukprot:1511179-Rhodomonas_salina.1
MEKSDRRAEGNQMQEPTSAGQTARKEQDTRQRGERPACAHDVPVVHFRVHVWYVAQNLMTTRRPESRTVLSRS